MPLNSDISFNYETKFLVPVSQRERFILDLVKQKIGNVISQASNSWMLYTAKFPFVTL